MYACTEDGVRIHHLHPLFVSGMAPKQSRLTITSRGGGGKWRTRQRRIPFLSFTLTCDGRTAAPSRALLILLGFLLLLLFFLSSGRKGWGGIVECGLMGGLFHSGRWRWLLPFGLNLMITVPRWKHIHSLRPGWRFFFLSCVRFCPCLGCVFCLCATWERVVLEVSCEGGRGRRTVGTVEGW